MKIVENYLGSIEILVESYFIEAESNLYEQYKLYFLEIKERKDYIYNRYRCRRRHTYRR